MLGGAENNWYRFSCSFGYSYSYDTTSPFYLPSSIFLFNQQPTTKNQPTNNQTTNHQVPKNILLLTFPALQGSWVVSVDVFYLIQKTRSWVISVDGVFDLLPSLKRSWVISVDGVFDFLLDVKRTLAISVHGLSRLFRFQKGAG